MKEKIRKLFKDTEFINYMLIVLIALILGIPICSNKLDIYFDDGIQHIARAFGTLQSFKEQGIFPNVISDFTNHFGYSWNLFYGPLSTYGVILFFTICRSFVTAYKLFCLFCLILSGIFMYKFMYSLTKNSNTSLLASVVYMTFPYHLTDWYIRNALGEYVSFIFIPLVFLGLYNLFNTTEKNYYLSIGAIGLILTHNISTALVAIFSLVYVICHWKNLKETRVKQGIIFNVIVIILVTAFFWAPMIEAKLSSNYQVYEKNAMATNQSVADQALKLSQLFATSSKNTFVFELGIHVIIMFGFSIMALKRVREDLKKEYIFFFISAIICVIMSTKIFPWKWMPSFVLIIQFPWRMLYMASFFLSIICAINMAIAIKDFKFKDAVIISVISIIYVCALCGFIPYTEKVYNIDEYSLGVMSGKEFEVVAGTGKAEYLPKKAFDNRFYIATRDDKINVLTGKAIIENEEKNGSHYKAKVQSFEETIFELPYIYYPGYEVIADGIHIDTFETENGFLGIRLYEDEPVEIEVNYTGTKIMKISCLISIFSFISFAIYVWKKR